MYLTQNGLLVNFVLFVLKRKIYYKFWILLTSNESSLFEWHTFAVKTAPGSINFYDFEDDDDDDDDDDEDEEA